jgi:hypothetical protein
MVFVPIDPRGFRLSVGLRALDLDTWLDAGNDFESFQEHKLRMLENQRKSVALMIPESLPAQYEIAQSILDHIGSARSLDEDFPLLTSAFEVREDLCVLERNETDWVLTAAVVASPSRWKLSEKIGTTMTNIHAPVPRYESELDHAVHVTFDKLTVDRPVYRFNWTLMDTAEKFQEASVVNPEVTAENAGSTVFFRVERQTLRRYPETDAILFTIGTYIHTLSDIFGKDESAAELLHRAVKTMAEDHAEYRSWQLVKPAVLAWLEACYPHFRESA